MNLSEEEEVEVPAGVVTVTSTVPLPGGDTAVIAVSESNVKWAGADPNLTPVAPLKSVPVTVTVVPPSNGPEPAETPVTATPITVTPSVVVMVVPSVFDTVVVTVYGPGVV